MRANIDAGDRIQLLTGAWEEPEPACGESLGRWYCATCREAFQNAEMEAHVSGDDEHRLAWLCAFHGLEVP